MQKTVLVVYAHPNSESFAGALRDITVHKLKALNYNVIESDLYKMNFNPVFTLTNTLPIDPYNGQSLSVSIKQSMEKNPVAPDVQIELDKLLSASYIIFIAPTWWNSVPAIMKGWFDRVLLRGFAFDFPDKLFNSGPLLGKKCLLVTTTGSSKEYFSKQGPLNGGQTLEENYWHIIEGVFAFCGMETLPIFAAYAMDATPLEERKKILADYEKSLETLETQKVIQCPLLHQGVNESKE